MEDTILYSSCFDANAGLFETLLTHEDAVISDELNHASIIDGIRLSKAKRYRYKNNNMNDLIQQLKQADLDGVRHKLIVTDGVFSMDGIVANLPGICDLADQYEALVMVDDSHAVGFMGATGKGTHEYHQVLDRVDIITGTLGKAMGGASGGYTAARKTVVDWLRQRSRPYLFSNSLSPAIVSASIKAIDLIQNNPQLKKQLFENADCFRNKMSDVGFTLAGADHAIIPIMLGEAKTAVNFAKKALAKGIFVIPFSYPVVPKGQARIRVQMSASHKLNEVDEVVNQLIQVGQSMRLI